MPGWKRDGYSAGWIIGTMSHRHAPSHIRQQRMHETVTVQCHMLTYQEEEGLEGLQKKSSNHKIHE